jgi:hypothetical protein
MEMNPINVIPPYRHHGMWVFDDSRVRLLQEPFVAGADNTIDRVVADFPDTGGNWYFSEELRMEGWLGPALLRYFSGAPQQLCIQNRSREEATHKQRGHL